MRAFKGIALLIITNLLIFASLFITFQILTNFVLPLFGIDIRGSVNANQLLWALVLGFGGAFISLLFSKQMARMGMQMQRIDVPQTAKEQLVYNTVAEQARSIGIKMPEVWVYWSEEPNAFATGPSRNNSMVAVSSGLVMNLNDDEVRAVLAHEMGHIQNGDMLAMTLLQGLMNTFVYWISMLVSRWFYDENGNPTFMSFMISMVLQIALSFLALIPVTWFSRRREFRADRFAAQQYGAPAMIAALERIHRRAAGMLQHETVNRDALATFKIGGDWQGLFATHPSLEARVSALQDWARESGQEGNFRVTQNKGQGNDVWSSKDNPWG